MIGMSRLDGSALTDDAHLGQSIVDILTTPIGTRVMRRDYGSMLFELIDGPLNALTRLRLFAAVAGALRRWEPRLTLTRVGVGAGAADGTVTIGIEGIRNDRPAANSLVRLSIPLPRTLA